MKIEAVKKLFEAIKKQETKRLLKKDKFQPINPKYLLTVNHDGFILVDDNITTANKIVVNLNG